MNIWFISDTHFGDATTLEICRPEFGTVDEMDDAMIERWNQTVEPGDRVYHLGDFARSNKRARDIARRLHGKIRLIVGNHDDIAGLAQLEVFERLMFWRPFPDRGFLATHVPLHASQLPADTFNLHGHVHLRTAGLESFHENLCVEAIGYRPVHIDEISARLRGRPGAP